MADHLDPPVSPELLAKLQKLAETARDDQADHETHEAADATLSVAYDEEGKWRINYTLPRKAVIGINNRQPAELARAQIRGMMADFAFRQNSGLQARVEALERALREALEIDFSVTCCYGDCAESECIRARAWREAARKLLEGTTAKPSPAPKRGTPS